MPPPSDRALRRLISDLATAPAKDIEAILAALDPAERRKVSDLLENLTDGGGVSTPTLSVPYQPLSTDQAAGMAPWLYGRLDDQPDRASLTFAVDDLAQETPRTPHLLTSKAREALRSALEEVRPLRSAPLHGPSAPRSGALYDWLQKLGVPQGLLP